MKRKCGICRQPAKYYSPVAAWCSHEHGAELAKRLRDKALAKKAKKEKQETRIKKQSLKPRSKLLAEAQSAFNAYIRARDAHLPCISCGVTTAAQWDAGHYRSVGAASHLRFNEDNVHKQCSRPCNKDKSGNLIEYRKGLVARIGVARVEALENDSRTIKLTVEDIQAIKAKYKQMTRDLHNEADRL